jgi:hypothetical protein
MTMNYPWQGVKGGSWLVPSMIVLHVNVVYTQMHYRFNNEHREYIK